MPQSSRLAERPSELQHESARNATSRARFAVSSILAPLTVLVVLAIAFSKTIFGGQPISRLYQLGQRDSLFSDFFSPVREGYDASVYQMFVPNHVVTGDALAQGRVPLWNCLSGCGAPYLADIQTAVFWPLRLPFLFMDRIQSWNLLIVGNLMLLALGSYILGRALGLGRWASVFAALSAALCPYLVFQSELIGGSPAWIPLVIACFVRLSRSGTNSARVVTALSCSAMVLSGHPEPAFFGIAMACSIFGILVVSHEGFTLPAIGKMAGNIAAVGALSFCFSAFSLLPFLELLINSDCYKQGLQGWDFGVPLNSILVNFIHPAYGNSSPFLGVVAPALLLAGAAAQWRSHHAVRALTITILLVIVFMCQLGPLEQVMHSKGFSWFVPKYCWPGLLILASMLSAFGLQLLAGNRWNGRARTYLILAFCAVACGLLLIKLFPSSLQAPSQDEAFVALRITEKMWLKDLLITLAALAILFSSLRTRVIRPWLAAILFVAFSAGSFLPITKNSSPVRPSIQYADIQPISFLRERGGRVISVGRHVFCPNTNMAYGIPNFVFTNPCQPERLHEFMSAAGMTHEGVNHFFDGRIGRAVDLASVKYLIAPGAVMAQDDPPAPAPAPLLSGLCPKWQVEDGEVSLSAASLSYHPHNSQLLASLELSIPPGRGKELALQAVLLDEKRNTIWFGDLERLDYLFSKESPKPVESASRQGSNEAAASASVTRTTPGPGTGDSGMNSRARCEERKKELSIAVPYTIPPGAQFTAAVKLFDWKRGTYAMLSDSASVHKLQLPSGTAEKPTQEVSKADDLFCLSTLTKEGHHLAGPVRPQAGSPADQHFRLLLEIQGKARIYENSRAVPEAYVVHRIVKAHSEDAALKAITAADFDPAAEVVIESSLPIHCETSAPQAVAAHEEVRVSRLDSDRVLVSCDLDRDGVLVLTDTYYPGWRAYLVEGTRKTELPIVRANYLFRGVAVPKGTFQVEFRYEPIAFPAGIALSVLAFVASLVTILAARAGSGKRRRLP